MSFKVSVDQVLNRERPKLRPRKPIKLRVAMPSAGPTPRVGCCGRGLPGGGKLVPPKG